MASLFCKQPGQAMLNVSRLRRTICTALIRNSKIQDTHYKEKSLVDSDVSGKGGLNLLSGIPLEQSQDRKVTIFLPSRNTMQSGTHNMRKWTISFDTKQRWENPLMGWASTGDPLSNTQVKFGSREAAINYCETHGWQYEIQEPTLPTTRPKSYGSNFSWNKRTRTSTK
ncbi:NADH dehydrogenase [ubiquinone] iron-sulfur protein 4, mitochondrial-like [Hydractinia symbiolongicarpus]|uniref:NADH dehydrogenase [ubiquinone] iron-sulfur protein 4, mitochondrial-like n=1 Tax=Hydractinia symbiolongicarpus TaxID=13093 RepID=UPI00254B0FD4|nr:NADH dehydrogenase [ubiquinone] iron-sulfur protein 4, mitochondrial-like [Hydractinia symbiolongicarpus]